MKEVNLEQIATFQRDLKDVPGFLETSKKQPTSCNLLFMTTNCNMACHYCFQKADRERLNGNHKELTEKEIDNFFLQIFNREGPTCPAVVVFWGGEPLMKMDLIKYAVKMGVNNYPNFSYSINTNGTLLNNEHFFQDFLKFHSEYLQHNYFIMEISYDCSGHSKRVFKGGAPTREIVENVIRKCLASGIRTSIRYTIQEANVKNTVKDAVFMLEAFPGLDRIVYNRGGTLSGKDLGPIINKLKYLEKRYGVQQVSYEIEGLMKTAKVTSFYQTPGGCLEGFDNEKVFGWTNPSNKRTKSNKEMKDGNGITEDTY